MRYRAKELLQTPLAMLRKLLDNSELKIVYSELEALISLNLRKEIDKNLVIENTFSLPEKLAKSSDTKCVLMLDEFPAISELKSDNSKIGEVILKKIRTIFEDWERTTLCISGSIRSTMKLAVLSSTSPFYRQLIITEVKPFERENTKELLSRVNTITDDGIEEIHNFSAGIPFYIQFIGKMLERRKGATLEEKGYVLKREKGYYMMEDPVFERWLKGR
ncbi:MAG: hypothetical protein WAV32_02065 [Halobacteriota archaeon]